MHFKADLACLRYCGETEETIAEWDLLVLRRWVNFTPAVWVRTSFILKVREAAVDPKEVQGFQRVCP